MSTLTSAQIADLIVVLSAAELSPEQAAQVAQLRAMADQIAAAEAAALGQQAVAIGSSALAGAADLTSGIGLRASHFLVGVFSALRR